MSKFICLVWIPWKYDDQIFILIFTIQYVFTVSSVVYTVRNSSLKGVWYLQRRIPNVEHVWFNIRSTFAHIYMESTQFKINIIRHALNNFLPSQIVDFCVLCAPGWRKLERWSDLEYVNKIKFCLPVGNNLTRRNWYFIYTYMVGSYIWYSQSKSMIGPKIPGISRRVIPNSNNLSM